MRLTRAEKKQGLWESARRANRRRRRKRLQAERVAGSNSARRRANLAAATEPTVEPEPKKKPRPLAPAGHFLSSEGNVYPVGDCGFVPASAPRSRARANRKRKKR